MFLLYIDAKCNFFLNTKKIKFQQKLKKPWERAIQYVSRGEIFNQDGAQTTDPSTEGMFGHLARGKDYAAQTEALERQQWTTQEQTSTS